MHILLILHVLSNRWHKVLGRNPTTCQPFPPRQRKCLPIMSTLITHVTHEFSYRDSKTPVKLYPNGTYHMAWRLRSIHEKKEARSPHDRTEDWNSFSLPSNAICYHLRRHGNQWLWWGGRDVKRKSNPNSEHIFASGANRFRRSRFGQIRWHEYWDQEYGKRKSFHRTNYAKQPCKQSI